MRGGRMGAWSRDLETSRLWWSRELEEIELGEIRGMDAEEILNSFYGQVAFTRGWVSTK